MSEHKLTLRLAVSALRRKSHVVTRGHLAPIVRYCKPEEAGIVGPKARRGVLNSTGRPSAILIGIALIGIALIGIALIGIAFAASADFLHRASARHAAQHRLHPSKIICVASGIRDVQRVGFSIDIVVPIAGVWVIA